LGGVGLPGARRTWKQQEGGNGPRGVTTAGQPHGPAEAGTATARHRRGGRGGAGGVELFELGLFGGCELAFALQPDAAMNPVLLLALV
jgi:hypothetical protein